MSTTLEQDHTVDVPALDEREVEQTIELPDGAIPSERPSLLGRRGRALRFSRPKPGRYLAIEDGRDTALLPVTTEVTSIGRSPRADIVIDDATVSAGHALLLERGRRLEIVDDRSLNGLLVNGQRTARARLTDGDRIQLGRVTLRYVEIPA